MISENRGCEEAVRHRVGAVRHRVGAVRHRVGTVGYRVGAGSDMWRQLSGVVCDKTVFAPVMMYGSETWAMRKVARKNVDKPIKAFEIRLNISCSLHT